MASPCGPIFEPGQVIASARKFSKWGEIQSKPDPDPINTCSKSYERKSNSILIRENRLEMNMEKKVDFRGWGTPFLGPPFLLRARVRARHGQKILGEPPNLGTFAPKSPISVPHVDICQKKPEWKRGCTPKMRICENSRNLILRFPGTLSWQLSQESQHSHPPTEQIDWK